MFKAVIFDFDGLILNTEDLWFEVYNEVAYKRFGINLDIKQFAQVVGNSETLFLELVEKEIELSFNHEDFKKEAFELFQKNYEKLSIRDGVLDYLIAAKELGFKIGIASSSNYDWVSSFLYKFHLINYFDVIKTSDIIGTKKPNPKVYIETLKFLNVSAKETIAFEDSFNGLKAATEAGIETVVFPNNLTKHTVFPKNTLTYNLMADISFKSLISVLKLKTNIFKR